MEKNTQEDKLDELDLQTSEKEDSSEDSLSLDQEQQTQEDFDSLGLIPDDKDEQTDLVEEKDDSNDLEVEKTEEIKTEDLVENSQSQTITEEVVEEKPIQQKQSKIKIILISIVGFLLLIIVVGAVLFFTGFFDPEVKKDLKVSKNTKEAVIKKEVEKYKFTAEDVNIKRLNRKLTLLTKYEIIENDDKELLKSKEKSYQEKLKKEKNLLIQENNKKEQVAKETKEKFKAEKDILLAKNKKLKDDLSKATDIHDKETASLKADTREIIKRKNALLQRIEKNGLTQTNKEELLKNSKEEISTNTKIESKKVLPDTKSSIIDENKIKEKDTKLVVVKKETMHIKESVKEVSKSVKEPKLIYFIEVKTIKNVIYNSFIQKIETAYNKIELCRDEKNKIEVFVGPFENIEDREVIIKKLQDKIVNELFTIDLNEEEYLKRCKY